MDLGAEQTKEGIQESFYNRNQRGAEQEQGGEGEPAAWAIGAGTWRRAGAEACRRKQGRGSRQAPPGSGRWRARHQHEMAASARSSRSMRAAMGERELKKLETRDEGGSKLR